MASSLDSHLDFQVVVATPDLVAATVEEDEHMLLCHYVINIDRASHGSNNTPETFRYISPTPAKVLQPFQAEKEYAIRLTATQRIGVGTLRSVRAADEYEVQIVVACDMFSQPVMINFPRALIDATFVESSAAVAILLKTPQWNYKMPWGFTPHTNPADTSTRAFTTTRPIEYVPIVAYTQATSAKPGVEPPTWALAWSSCQLRYDMYLEIEYLDMDMFVQGRVLGIRAFEVAWVEVAVIVHPYCVWFTRTDFIYLTVPYTHITLGETVHREVLMHADGLPRLLLSCGLRRPLPILARC